MYNLTFSRVIFSLAQTEKWAKVDYTAGFAIFQEYLIWNKIIVRMVSNLNELYFSEK